jgi:hypothetical protein
MPAADSPRGRPGDPAADQTPLLESCGLIRGEHEARPGDEASGRVRRWKSQPPLIRRGGVRRSGAAGSTASGDTAIQRPPSPGRGGDTRCPCHWILIGPWAGPPLPHRGVRGITSEAWGVLPKVLPKSLRSLAQQRNLTKLIAKTLLLGQSSLKRGQNGLKRGQERTLRNGRQPRRRATGAAYFSASADVLAATAKIPADTPPGAAQVNAKHECPHQRPQGPRTRRPERLPTRKRTPPPPRSRRTRHPERRRSTRSTSAPTNALKVPGHTARAAQVNAEHERPQRPPKSRRTRHPERCRSHGA